MLLEQIDTMSEVANAFSDFATLPKPKLVKSDLVEITEGLWRFSRGHYRI